MSSKTTVASLSAALVLAAFCGYFYLEMRKEALRADRAIADIGGLESKLSAAEDEAGRLRSRLEEARRREEALRARAVAAAVSAAPAKEEEAAPQPAVEKTAAALLPRTEPAVLAAFEDADQLAAEFIARGDIRGLWLLAADLLGYGEPGYEKILALAKLLDEKEIIKEQLNPLWHEEELLAGSFFRSVADRHEDLLRFGLYLDRKDPRQVPKFIGELQRELAQHIGPALIGYYRGDDPEILGGYAEFFRKRLSENPQTPDHRKLDLIRGLGQIPTEEATDALIEALSGASPDVQSSAVAALAWQRNPRAIPVLRNLLAVTQEPRLRRKIEAALRYLE